MFLKVSTLDDKSTSPDNNAAKTLALDHLGVIAAQLRTSTLKFKRGVGELAILPLDEASLLRSGMPWRCGTDVILGHELVEHGWPAATCDFTPGPPQQLDQTIHRRPGIRCELGLSIKHPAFTECFAECSRVDGSLVGSRACIDAPTLREAAVGRERP